MNESHGKILDRFQKIHNSPRMQIRGVSQLMNAVITAR